MLPISSSNSVSRPQNEAHSTSASVCANKQNYKNNTTITETKTDFKF